MKIEANPLVTLPVGILKDGARIREVYIDEFRAADTKIMTSPAFQKNVSSGLSTVLGRIVQEIPGVVPRKKSPTSQMADVSVFDKMAAADRQTILLQALLLSDDEARSTAAKCPHCGQTNEVLHDLSTVEVHELVGDGTIEFDLPRGLPMTYKGEQVVVKKGKLRLVTGEDEAALSKFAHEGVMAVLLRQISLTAFDVDVVGKLAPRDLDMLSKSDCNYLQKLIGERTCGPDVLRDESCAYCSETFQVAIDLSAFFN